MTKGWSEPFDELVVAPATTGATTTAIADANAIVMSFLVRVMLASNVEDPYTVGEYEPGSSTTVRDIRSARREVCGNDGDRFGEETRPDGSTES
jgi:hypothetical protein